MASQALAQSFSRRTQATLRLFHLVDQDRNRGDRVRPAGQLLINGTPIALETQGDLAVVFVGPFRLVSVYGDEPLQAVHRAMPFVHAE